MPSARTKYWTHQQINGSQNGDGGNCIFTEDVWTTGGLILEGSTLLRTVVQGDFHIGPNWNPAGLPPFGNVAEDFAFDFAVYVDPNFHGPLAPPPLTDSSTEFGVVWRANFVKVGATYASNYGQGSTYIAHLVSPSGRASESFARRGPAVAGGGQTYFQWRFDSKYAVNGAAITAGYNVGGVVFGWVLAGNISIDQLWLAAPA